MAHLPLTIQSESLRCLLIGGGAVAQRKLATLISHQVPVRIVAKEIGESLNQLAAEHKLPCDQRRFDVDDLEGINFVICATGDESLNREVAEACTSRSIWVNVVDNQSLSTATFPAIVKRGEVSIAIATDGQSPTLARRLKSKIDAILNNSLGAVASFLAEKRREHGGLAHRQLWDEVLDSVIPDLLEQGARTRAEQVFQSLKDQSNNERGFVSLVGAGPGDPALLTLKAVRRMERADVVYYDNLVSADVLAMVRKDAELVYVGKKRRFKSIRQAEINQLLLQEAKTGKRVVRLKGGDPFLFGRGGEEIETLAENGVPFEVVPGITAALGCAAYANIPLTHRDYSQSVRFVTGHTKADQINLDWPELAKPDQTLVVYMGLANLDRFTKNLLSFGMPPHTPIAIISKATSPDQLVLDCTLEEVPSTLSQANLESPTTAIIGEVVRVRERLTRAKTPRSID